MILRCIFIEEKTRPAFAGLVFSLSSQQKERAFHIILNSSVRVFLTLSLPLILTVAVPRFLLFLYLME
jgi:hypothetical protein